MRSEVAPSAAETDPDDTAPGVRSEVAPSMLAADASRLGEECRAVEAAGADRLHWDVMDGVFVPNLTFGPDVVAACRPLVGAPFEAHLMVIESDSLAPRYVEAGCSTVLIHVEACPHLHRSLAAIAETGARCGVVLNPHTPASSISEVLGMIDQVLVMTVNPGFGGQSYIASVESKIATVRRMIDESGRHIDLEVDGGISATTAGAAVAAGANVLVAGSAVFGHRRRTHRSGDRTEIGRKGHTIGVGRAPIGSAVACQCLLSTLSQLEPMTPAASTAPHSQSLRGQ